MPDIFSGVMIQHFFTFTPFFGTQHKDPILYRQHPAGQSELVASNIPSFAAFSTHIINFTQKPLGKGLYTKLKNFKKQTLWALHNSLATFNPKDCFQYVSKETKQGSSLFLLLLTNPKITTVTNSVLKCEKKNTNMDIQCKLLNHSHKAIYFSGFSQVKTTIKQSSSRQ